MKSTQWKEQVPACFGTADLKWGSAALDESTCKTMLKTALEEGATTADVVEETRQYLASRGATPQHIEKKVALLTNLSR